MREPPLCVEYDEFVDILTVEGVQYSGTLMREFGLGPRPDTLMRIVKSTEGIVTIQTYRVNLEDFERWHQRWCERYGNL